MKIDTLGSPSSPFDVIIIGGGSTGAGTARDCSKRGLTTLLVEQSDIATGATGRNHGLLHSGARYAVTDQESAQECIKENLILKRIASHCVEESDGLFISLPEDGLDFQNSFIEACERAGIPVRALSPEEAIRREPSVNHDLIGAVQVPDGTVDPFRLTAANIIDAKDHGSAALTYHRVMGLIVEQGRAVGIEMVDLRNKEKKRVYAQIVVNAGGIWGQRIAEYADLRLSMFPAKGSLLIYGHRVNGMVLNRCRKPADADILVPGDTICLIGTTSLRIPYDEIDDVRVTPEEVNLLMQEGEKLSPVLARTRILRAYAGVRPLVASDDDPSGRSVSRGIVLLDHAKRDGLEGFITITGGKLMTYRLMAEWATDLVCKKLCVDASCTTAVDPLPGAQYDIEEINKKMHSVPHTLREATLYRHGGMTEEFAGNLSRDRSLVCECEEISVAEVEYAIQELDVHNLIDLRRRTRVGMGTCQGELCACRAAGLMHRNGKMCTASAKGAVCEFLNERWRGILPTAWGESLRGSEYAAWVYECVCGLEDCKTVER